MKQIKRLLAVIFAVTMFFGTGVNVYAGDTDYTLTINNNGDTEHTFEVYQIFSGNVSDGKLINIAWADGVTSGGQTALGDAAIKAKSITSETEAITFANLLVTNGYLDSSKKKTVTIAAKQSDTVSGLTAGYYLIKDLDNSQNDKEKGAYTLFLLEVVGDTESTTTTKLDVPSVTKKVADANDTNAIAITDPESVTSWLDSADHDINDVIPYKLEGTLPTNFDKYTTYSYVFTDTISKGLTYNTNSVSVYKNSIAVGNKIDPTKYTVSTTAYNGEEQTYKDGTVLTVSFSDLKDQSLNLTSSDKIIVTYKCTLNSDAVLGATGNPNKVYLTYSNNPNGSGTGKTPEDLNIVFTYKLLVNKYKDEVKDANKLNGATFKLYKELANNTVQEITLTSSGNTFTATGIDDGTYILQETKAPAGYNKIDGTVTFGSTTYQNAKEFEVTATHTDGDSPTLSSLSGNPITGSVITFTTDSNNSQLSTDVIDKSGSTLPETGGIGTTVFYVIGGVLVAGAAVMLIAKNKMSKN